MLLSNRVMLSLSACDRKGTQIMPEQLSCCEPWWWMVWPLRRVDHQSMFRLCSGVHLERVTVFTLLLQWA